MQTRAFMGADFSPIASVMGSTWHSQHGNNSHWQGADELCLYLSMSDHGIVALDDDGNLAGAILLRSPRAQDHNEVLRMHWLQQRMIMADTARALGIDSRADVQVLPKEDALLEGCIGGRESEGIGVIKLLIVSGDARGMGVGGTLLREGVAWLEAHECQKVCLLTDEDCDWQFYEHVGMRRVAEDMATLTAPDGESFNLGMFVYEAALEELKTRLG